MRDETPFLLAAVLLAIALLAGASSAEKHATATVPACHARADGELPDPRCTPGVRSHRVVPTNVRRTICRPGYATSVRPPSAYTSTLKRLQIRQYGYADKRLSSYQEDHLIPLSSGGSPTSVRNLWPEPIASAHRKDRVERLAHSQICKGWTVLRVIQQSFADDWRRIR